MSFTGNVSLHSNTVMTVEALLSANEVTLSSIGNLVVSGADRARPAGGITATERTRLASLDGVFISRAGPGLLSGPARQAIYTSDINFLFSLDGMTRIRRVDTWRTRMIRRSWSSNCSTCARAPVPPS